MKLVELVEYRFDYEFVGNKEIDPVEVVEAHVTMTINNGFMIDFWCIEPILVFVVIYLKTVKQLTFEHPITI